MKTKERTVGHTAEEIGKMIRRGEDKTDWEAFKAINQDQLEELIADDADEAGWEWGPPYAGLPKVIGEPKKQLTVRLDPDIVNWFKSQGKGYQTRMNAALRQYMDHHQEK